MTIKISRAISLALLVLLALSLVISFSYNADAKSSGSFYLKSESVKSGRIFSIDIYAKGDTLSCGKFTLTYDKKIMSYRNSETAINNAQVEAVDSSGKATLIFLYDSGLNIKKDTKIASVKFKANSSGQVNVWLSVSQCVDKNVADVSVSSAYGCKVTIGTKGITATTDKTITQKNNKNDTEKTSQKDSGITVIEDEEETSIAVDNTKNTESSITINKDSSPVPYFIGGAVAVALIALLFMAYKIGVKKGKGHNGFDE